MSSTLAPSAALAVDDSPFLAAIAREPDDDTRRLGYADWLDEHNEPERAEYIRLMIVRHRAWEAARGTGRPFPPSAGPKFDGRRLNGIMRRHRAAWLGSDFVNDCAGQCVNREFHEVYGQAGGPLGRHLVGVRFERGFVEAVCCDSFSTVVTNVEEWLRRWPLRRVFVSSHFGPRFAAPWSALLVITPAGVESRWTLQAGSGVVTETGLGRVAETRLYGTRAELAAGAAVMLREVYERDADAPRLPGDL